MGYTFVYIQVCFSLAGTLSPQEMTHEERQLITDLEKCDFAELFQMHKDKVEARRNMSKEEKQVGALSCTSSVHSGYAQECCKQKQHCVLTWQWVNEET